MYGGPREKETMWTSFKAPRLLSRCFPAVPVAFLFTVPGIITLVIGGGGAAEWALLAADSGLAVKKPNRGGTDNQVQSWEMYFVSMNDAKCCALES